MDVTNTMLIALVTRRCCCYAGVIVLNEELNWRTWLVGNDSCWESAGVLRRKKEARFWFEDIKIQLSSWAAR